MMIYVSGVSAIWDMFSRGASQAQPLQEAVLQYTLHQCSPPLTLHYTYLSVPLPLFQALGSWEFELNSMTVLNQLYFKVQEMY
jgi:hypothetical protein